MDCRCIACILSGKEDAVFNYPCISPIKTYDYITLQQNVPKVPGVCDRRQAAAVPVSGWAQVTPVRSMAEGSRAHDHHCPSLEASGSCAFVLLVYASRSGEGQHIWGA